MILIGVFFFLLRLLDWRPDKLKGEPLKCERVVVLKNLFTPEDFDKEVALILDYQQDIRSECSKCGEVKKVTLFDVSYQILTIEKNQKNTRLINN